MRDFALLYINGQRHEVRGRQAGMMVSDYLRYDLALTGTKIVCAEGDCGACTLLRWFPFPQKRSDPSPFQALNSCIATVAQLDGSSLVTVEGLRQANGGEFTPVQEAMVKANGSQCGFCTPGFVMAITALVERKLSEPKTDKVISEKQAKNYLTGNLCRCTGYTPILYASMALDLNHCSSLTSKFLTSRIKKELRDVLQIPLTISSDSFSCFAPISALSATKFKVKNPQSLLLSAGTDLGVLSNKNKIKFHQTMSLHQLPELYQWKKTTKGGRLYVGARVTVAELRRITEKTIPEFSRFLDLFASPQIKNVATLVGNVANASPIADTPPFLLVANSLITIAGPKGIRTLPLENYYLAYKKTALGIGEWIQGIEFDIPSPDESLALFKSSQRKDLDISCINAAFRISWSDKKKSRVTRAQLAMGGVAAIPLRLPKSERFLKGKEISPEVVSQAVATVHSELNPLSDLRGTSAYRRLVLENFLLKFFSSLVVRQS